MANFVTEDDKRIYDLQPINTGEAITDYQLVLDKQGNVEAKRITIPNFINRLFPNLPKQLATSGTSNPDNASGTNGDLYFKTAADSLTLYQKSSGSWQQVFNIPIGGSTSTEFRRTFLIPAGTLATDGVLSLVGLTNEQGDQLIPDKPNSSVYDGSSGAVYRLDKTINGLETDEDGLTVRDVLVVLNGVEPIGNFQNNSVVDIEYAIDGGATSILQSGSSTNISFPNTDLTVRSISDASPDIFIYNQSGKLSDIDGQQTAISSAPNYYIVPSDTSNLYIDN